MQCKRTIVSYSVMAPLSLVASLAVMSGTAAASGFALIEQSGSGLGNAFAGGAASAEDASTVFFNPAGMSRLSGKQIAVAANAIKLSAEFADNGASVGAPLQTAGGNGGDAGSVSLVPNAYFMMEVNPQTRFGLGINAPFGLQTEYDANWIGRFQAIKSKLETVNLNPAVSYQVNDKISVGAGLNYQRITGELTSAVNYSALAGGALGAGLEGVSTVSGSDSAWGYNFGALFNFDPQTRLGLAYRSQIKYTLDGAVSFTNVPGPIAANPALQNGAVNLPITMPDSFSLSGFHQIGDKWDLMADATWTGWSVLQQLKIDRTNGSNVQTVQENWKDTWRVSAGATYHYSAQWLARAGGAFDQAPVSDTYRTARIPDADRTWLSVGGQYKPSKDSALDFGYAHLFVKDASINQTIAGAGSLIGNYSNSVDILSLQYVHKF